MLYKFKNQLYGLKYQGKSYTVELYLPFSREIVVNIKASR